MPRTDVNVPTPDGECPSIVITPDGDGPWPAVILYMDAGGVRPAMVTMAERLAAMGYVAFLPEMYYRSGPLRAVRRWRPCSPTPPSASACSG